MDFNQHDRLVLGQGLRGALEHLEFMTFNVAFDETDRTRQSFRNRIERHDRSLDLLA